MGLNGRLGGLVTVGALLGALAGCPGTTRTTGPETIAHPHVSPPVSTAAPARSGDPSNPLLVNHGVQQSPVPFEMPSPEGDSPQPLASGASPPGSPGTYTLGPFCSPTPVPSGAPILHYDNGTTKLYAGPFTLPNGPTTIRIIYAPTIPSANFLVHLDTADQVSKELLIQASGRVKATFAFPKRIGSRAFYLQNDDMDATWSIDVWGPPASPSPDGGASSAASASPGGSPVPSGSPSSAGAPASASPSPAASGSPASP